MEADDIIKALIAGMAVLGLVTKGLIDLVRAKREAESANGKAKLVDVKELFAAQEKVIRENREFITTRTQGLLTYDQARHLMRQCMDDGMEKVPCYGVKRECAAVIRSDLGALAERIERAVAPARGKQ